MKLRWRMTSLLTQLSMCPLRTLIRCTLVVLIVMLPPTAGCRHPFGKAAVDSQYAWIAAP